MTAEPSGHGRWAAVGLAAAAPVLLIAFRLLFSGRTPEQIPTHWNLHGQVDRTAGSIGFFLVLLALSLVLAIAAIVAVLLRRHPGPARISVAALLFGSWLATGIFCTTMAVSAGARTAQQVSFPWYAVVIVLVVPLLAGAAGWSLLPADRLPAVPIGTDSTLQFGDTERVVWVGRASSLPVRWIAVLALVASAVLVVLSVPVAVVVFVASLLLIMVSELGVRVDESGLHTLWGPFGRPCSTIALSNIAGSRAEQIQPMHWGGWGLRFSARGTAAIVRSGPGIVVDRVGGSRYAVTVDGAEQGAEVLNALLARDRRAG
ncbi:DUF1648 domain-containing protein [Nakamurella lactea]|uniref:DUF1648 domain-containing protein n=1 Tax=Nakamurella lactea TaxID=459515 RepID=UPI00042262FA|nr:DUF1648 domain-containing protein [Nakamurella lactea]